MRCFYIFSDKFEQTDVYEPQHFRVDNPFWGFACHNTSYLVKAAYSYTKVTGPPPTYQRIGPIEVSIIVSFYNLLVSSEDKLLKWHPQHPEFSDTTFTYQLSSSQKKNCKVAIQIHSMEGQIVYEEVFDGEERKLCPGSYSFSWDGTTTQFLPPGSAPPGLYSYNIIVEGASPYDRDCLKSPNLQVKDVIIGGMEKIGKNKWEVKLHYLLEDSAGLDASKVIAQAYDLRLACITQTQGETKANLPNATQPYWSKASLSLNVFTDGLFRFPIIPTDNHFPSYKNHQNKKCIMKGAKLQVVDPVIFLDPGHGGEDPGALCRNTQHEPRHQEKDINLAIAQRSEAQIEGCPGPEGYRQSPCRVYVASQTEEKNGEEVRKEYKKRAKEAIEDGAEVIICLHCNASENPGASGTEAYYHPSYSLSENLASSIVAGICGFYDDLPNRGIFDVTQGATRQRSRGAVNILGAYNKVYRKMKEKEPQKIKAEWIALVLVEMAFISTPSPDEEILLKNAYENYTGIRVAIHRGIRNTICPQFGLNQCPLPGIYP